MRPVFSLIFLILLLHACKTTTLVDDAEQDPLLIEVDYGKPQIMTVILEFILDPDNVQDQIIMKHKIVSPGKLKLDDHKLNIEDKYQLAFVNKSGEEIKRISISDPLRKDMEYSSEPGKLETKKVVLDKDAVPLRINFSADISHLKIYTQHNLELNLLMTFELL